MKDRAAVMTDVMTKEERSRCMAAVKGRDTKPEMTVRKFLFSKGLRYRVNNRKLPGSPDIVLRKYKTVVFVDGCFWHGHDGCRYFRMPGSNVDFWEHKISHNKARDVSNTAVLGMMGWKVIRVWECDIKAKSRRDATLDRIYREIVGIPEAGTPASAEAGITAHTADGIPAHADIATGRSIPSRHRIAAEPDAPYGETKGKE